MQNRDPYKPYDSSVQTDPMEPTSTEPTTDLSSLGQKGAEIKDRMADAGRSAMHKAEQGRQSAAGALDRAADALHRKADSFPGGQKTTDIAHNAAEKLQSTAHYLREHDFRDMISDFEDVVRRRPGQALLGALAVGFLVGRSFRRQQY